MSPGWPERFPVLQPPNAPLLVAQVAWLVGAVSRGPLRAFAGVVFCAGLTVWATGELASGANWVRRSFGAIGLAYVAARIARR